MNQFLSDKTIQFTYQVFKAIIVSYFFVALYYFLRLPPGGDELLFIEDLDMIHTMGWLPAITKGVSIPWMMLAYPFSFFLETYVALRLVNVLLLIVLLLYINAQKQEKSSLMLYYLLFFFSTVGICYWATNDFLFEVGLVVFFYETYKATQNRNANLNIAITGLVISFFTRQLFVVYLPVIILGLFVFYKREYRINRNTFYPAILFLAFIIFNLPSITKNHVISWDNKVPPVGIKASWSQRQYLAQLLVNDHKLQDGQHPSWEETDNYLKTHGPNSLPDGLAKGVLFDIKLTILEFFKDFYYCMTYQIRTLGLILFISFFYMARDIWKRKLVFFDYYIPFSTLLMLLIFSLIIISYVELRWVQPLFIMMLVYFADFHKKDNISKLLTNANVLVFALLAVYGIVRMIHKI